MDFDFLGLLSVVAVALIVVSVAKIQPAIAPILYVALGIRILAIFLNQDILFLPDSSGDALRFELKGQEWSEKGFLYLASNSKVLTIIFKLFIKNL